MKKFEIDLDALEQKARAATPGEWVNVAGCRGQVHHARSGHLIADCPTYADASFVATASPDVVLALVARLPARAQHAFDDEGRTWCLHCRRELPKR